VGPAPLVDYQTTLVIISRLSPRSLNRNIEHYLLSEERNQAERTKMNFSTHVFYVWEPRDPLTHPAPRSLWGRYPQHCCIPRFIKRNLLSCDLMTSLYVGWRKRERVELAATYDTKSDENFTLRLVGLKSILDLYYRTFNGEAMVCLLFFRRRHYRNLLPSRRAFTITYLKQPMSLGYAVLQLSRLYNLRCT
jgi:hypothetical protein